MTRHVTSRAAISRYSRIARNCSVGLWNGSAIKWACLRRPLSSNLLRLLATVYHSSRHGPKERLTITGSGNCGGAFPPLLARVPTPDRTPGVNTPGREPNAEVGP